MSRPFRRRGDGVLARFTPAEAAALRQVVGEVVTLLDDRASRPQRGEPSADPMAAIVGIDSTPRPTPRDPVMARLLPDGYRDDPDAAAELRSLTESSLREGKLGRAATVLEQLPAEGGTVRLSRVDAGAWLSALNDVRLALGTRLGITDDLDLEAEVTADPAGDRSQALILYGWLTWAQETLVEAVSSAD